MNRSLFFPWWLSFKVKDHWPYFWGVNVIYVPLERMRWGLFQTLWVSFMSGKISNICKTISIVSSYTFRGIRLYLGGVGRMGWWHYEIIFGARKADVDSQRRMLALNLEACRLQQQQSADPLSHHNFLFLLKLHARYWKATVTCAITKCLPPARDGSDHHHQGLLDFARMSAGEISHSRATLPMLHTSAERTHGC